MPCLSGYVREEEGSWVIGFVKDDGPEAIEYSRPFDTREEAETFLKTEILPQLVDAYGDRFERVIFADGTHVDPKIIN